MADADVLARLRVDSQQYDEKLKRAVSQLQQVEKEVRRTGATFAVADKEEMAFIQSLGKMDTVSTSTKGKISELTNAYTELSVMFKNLTDEEKKSGFGQAMQGSMQELRGRIGELQGQMSSAKEELGGLGGVATDLAGKLGIPSEAVTQLTGALGNISPAAANAGRAIVSGFSPVGAAIAAVVLAAKELADAFRRNEDATTALQKIAAPFKAVWQSVQRLFDDIVRVFVDVFNSVESVAGGFSLFRVAMAPVAGVIAYMRVNFAVLGTVLKDIAKGFALLGNTIKKAFQGTAIQKFFDAVLGSFRSFFSNISALLTSIGESRIGKALGLDELAQEIKNIVRAQNELVNSNRQIAESENALKKNTRTTNEQNAGDQQTIERLRAEASDKDKYSAAERVKMLEQAGALEEQIMQRNLKLRQDELDLIRLKNSLTQSGTEDLDAESAAVVALKEAETDYYSKKRALQRQLQTAKNEAVKEGEQAGTPAHPDKQAAPALPEKAVRDAAAMWEEHAQKIEDMKARLSEFRAMAADMGNSEEMRQWADGMAEQYQEQLDKMTASTEEAAAEIADTMEEAVDDMQSSWDNLKSGIGAVGSIVGSMDSIKQAGEDLVSVFNGEQDAWDSMMTVMNAGLSVMQSVMTIMEAINTLTTLSTALKKTKIATDVTEAATAQTTAATEVAAEGEKAAASSVATAANMGEAASGAGKAMSGIPIVGPVLAVAAIAAVIAAIIAAVSKAKSAKNSFSHGGMVGGNSPSGDNVVAFLNSGEGVLTAQGVQNTGNLLAAQGVQQNMQLTTRVSGTDLMVCLDSTNRARGGKRGEYRVRR